MGRAELAVGPDAALLERKDLREDLLGLRAISPEDVGRIRRGGVEWMREDVAFSKEGKQLRLNRPVHHDRETGRICDFSRRLHDLKVVRQVAVLAVHPDLDAQNAIAIRPDGTDGRPRIDHSGIEVNLVRYDQTD